MTRHLRLLPVCAGFLVLGSCSKDKAGEPSDCFPANYQVSYQTDIQPIIDKSCGSSTNCHAAGVTTRPSFVDYAAFKNELDNGLLEQHVVQDRYMPPVWGPDSVQFDAEECGEPERELIRLWIEQGAQDN